jgi:hypothetical protein
MFPIFRSIAASSGSGWSAGESGPADLGCWCGGSGALPTMRVSDVSDGGTVGFAGAIKPLAP